ncbi:protein UL49 [Wood mouse herpesvirus]|uniref:Protein UL49 n=1 Tax=Wood mouse herpesvirus TaxID=432370 RepID=D0U1Q5_9GAMA|nr:protein UL49 [Wood mouse herpesvirus]ACY41136.1 protein UL49 [Wood mouse herpesvirus]
MVMGALEYLRLMNISVDEFRSFCIYGHLCGQRGWAELLLSNLSLKRAVCHILKIQCETKKRWTNKVLVANSAVSLLTLFRMVLHECVFSHKYFMHDSLELKCFPLTKILTVPFLKALDLYLSQFSISCKFPIIKISTVNPTLLAFTKKKYLSSVVSDQPIEVPAPSSRPDPVRFAAATSLASEEQSLVKALHSSTKTVQCGNPLYYMMTRLCLYGLMHGRGGIVPVTSSSKQSVYDVAIRFIGSRILSPIVRLPILSRALAELALAGHGHQITVCKECGHCLNLGRDKFLAVNFSPTSMFYCRDQKEKQFNICATTGRIYCSYCGATEFTVYDMVGRYSTGEPFIRAVSSANSLSILENSEQECDMLIPCFGKSRSCSIKLRVTFRELLYLTASVDNFICQKCSNKGDE